MRTIKIFASLFFFSLISCKDSNQQLLDDLSGTWKVEQITYSKIGNATPDSVVKYPVGILQLDNCELTGSNRECSGYYNLTGKEKVRITFNANASEKKTFITVFETATPSINLNGDYSIDENTKNKLIIQGPQASIKDYRGRTYQLNLSK
jgi:hypothetical protein